MAAPSSKGLSLAGQAFFGSLCVGTFGLGVWQTQRYFQKVELVAQRTADLAQDPVAPANCDDALRDSFRRFQLTGKFDYNREILVGPRGPPPGALPDKPGSSAAGMSSAPQGYHVVTPMYIIDDDGTAPGGGGNSDKGGKNKSQKVVLVNRGWVPREYVVPERRRQRNKSNEKQDDDLLLQWDRPRDTVSVTVVPTKFEKPKSFLIAQHDFQAQPPRLFWLDPVAMHAAAGLAYPENEQDRRPFVTAVKEDEDALSLPLPPSAQKCGDFHVTPAVHVGYGLTWYGLSAAGIYMTRKMMTRGRAG